MTKAPGAIKLWKGRIRALRAAQPEAFQNEFIHSFQFAIRKRFETVRELLMREAAVAMETCTFGTQNHAIIA